MTGIDLNVKCICWSTVLELIKTLSAYYNIIPSKTNDLNGCVTCKI